MWRGLAGLIAIALLAAAPMAQPARSQNVLNANTAGEPELLQLPHVTPALARTIIGRRPLPSIRDLDAILKELSRQQRTELYGRLFVPINLNTATDAEILLIPGLGQRMLHEFKEYRPYKSMEQFRREIGKYVSKQEVARLEQYVTLSQ
jgi:DNA uptake protein ComE-like DNA-binding protein